METREVAAVADDRDPKGLVHDLAHAVPFVLAQRHAPGPPLQQVLGGNQAAAVRQQAPVQLIADILDHVVG